VRIYKDCYEMIREVERDLFEMGIKFQSETVQDKVVKDDPNFMTLELTGYDYKLTGYDKLDEMLKYLNISEEWVSQDFMERIEDKFLNPGDAWKINSELWEQYLHDGMFQYTYNERIRGQLPLLLRELTSRRNTRQGIITIYDYHQDIMNWGSKGRVPCSMYYQFFIRNNKLQMIYVMRSCDFLKHFAGDVALAIKMLFYISEKINVEVGTFTHFIGSLHAFYIDLNKRGIF